MLTEWDAEILEGFFFVDFLPTSENLCKMIFDLAKRRMQKIGIRVNRVEWNETPKSRAVFEE